MNRELRASIQGRLINEYYLALFIRLLYQMLQQKEGIKPTLRWFFCWIQALFKKAFVKDFKLFLITYLEYSTVLECEFAFKCFPYQVCFADSTSPIYRYKLRMVRVICFLEP